MMKSTICALIVLISLATSITGGKISGKIVGGVEIPIEAAPYQVSFHEKNNFICGGTLINNSYNILTAAHCCHGRFVKNLRVRAGSSKFNSGGDLVQVSEIIQHPNYDSKTYDFDVCILKLAKKIVFSSKIKPIALPTAQIVAGASATVSGWGTLSAESTTIPNNLQAVSIPIVSQITCVATYGIKKFTPRMICAGYMDSNIHKDACQGDSGGPLVANNTLYGIVSWGVGCANPQYPGVYTNIAAFTDWIVQNMR